jgi:hypothetical protein
MDSKMPGKRGLTFAGVTLTAIAVFLLMRIPAAAQDVTEAALKAALIYNFSKFTSWPAGALSADGPFVMCVLGDEVVGRELERTVKSRVLAGHSLAVQHLAPGEPERACRVLYVSGIPASQIGRIIGGLHDTPVLTISDMDGFTELGGIAQVFFEHGQLRFNIHNESAKRAGLQISAKLLSLAIRKSD